MSVAGERARGGRGGEEGRRPTQRLTALLLPVLYSKLSAATGV